MHTIESGFSGDHKKLHTGKSVDRAHVQAIIEEAQSLLRAKAV